MVPGLYCTGNPTPASPVIVTGNYKLTFDAVRQELSDVDAWLLVVDTRGINIWCAAGKNLFSTQEVIQSVIAANLHELVSHREIILPQLGATGVAAHKVHKGCGFKVVYGPMRAADLPAFLAAGNQATQEMRTATFTLKERAELIPVELFLLNKQLAICAVLVFALSGFGPDFYSFSAAWTRGLAAITATIFGIVSGCVVVPLMLNQLPWRMFWPKGALTGVVAGVFCILLFSSSLSELGSLAMVLWTTAVSSYMAMNFTGSTPYTSPSGVEAEMRRGLPFQAGGALIAAIAWLVAPFLV